MTLDIAAVRRAIPALATGDAYIDNASTTQVPRQVLDAVLQADENGRANVHRGLYPAAARATESYEAARRKLSHFLGASRPEEIIFTKNATEGINLVAQSWGRANLKAGDTVVLSSLEHHGNIVPWLQLKDSIGINLAWLEIDDLAESRFDAIKTIKPKLVAITGQSNVIGLRPNLPMLIEAAHGVGALVLIDGAQLAAHAPIDVQKLDCDFLALSGHKIYGPTGSGVLYGKRKLLEAMPPFMGGGMMIREVTRDGFTAADIPAKFEAGTPGIAQAIGLGAAIDWQSEFSWPDRIEHEQKLTELAVATLRNIPGLKILGPQQEPKGFHGCIGFVIDGTHPHDIAEIAGQKGVCLRAGHHCCQPLHDALNAKASARLSIGLYNNEDDIHRAAEAISEAASFLKA